MLLEARVSDRNAGRRETLLVVRNSRHGSTAGRGSHTVLCIIYIECVSTTPQFHSFVALAVCSVCLLSGSPTMAPSVVEKLSMLRAFVGETTFSETDLATCLRQSGYLVELAAERLMTGQYQPKQHSRQQQHPQRSSSSSSSSSPPILPNQGLSPKTIETTTTTPMPSTASHKRKHQHPTGRPVVTPKTPKTQPSSSPSYSSSSSSSSTANNDNDGRWLLCQRWISDGVCTQRHASTDFDESLAVEQPTNPQAGSNAGSSNSNSSSSSMMIRFRGRNIQGQFPKHIGRMATPLLQENLIEVTAKALMEERGLPIGAQVAFSMRYVVDLICVCLRIPFSSSKLGCRCVPFLFLPSFVFSSLV